MRRFAASRFGWDNGLAMTDPVPTIERPPGRQTMLRPAAVLWDFDGTLADTEPLWIDAEFSLVSSLGGTWSHEHAEHMVGNSLVDSGAYILEVIGRPDLSPEWVVDQLVEQVVIGLSERPVPWRPGAIALLQALNRHRVPCALVSASYRVILDAALTRLPAGRFDDSVAGDEVSAGKPDPEPYVEAARRLGVRPESCIVIEDSTNGATSGNAAGAVVVAVENYVRVPAMPRRVHRSSLVGLDLDQLAEILGAANAGQ
jgi:HAD superfamily hydrolase (TIGR01509 family)